MCITSLFPVSNIFLQNVMNIHIVFTFKHFLDKVTLIMEYGSTPYVRMARKKVAAPYNAYKIIRSELTSDYSHRLL